LAGLKHLILDVNVVIDLWLEKRSFQSTKALFRCMESGDARLWVTTSSLATLDYVTRRAFKRSGLSSELTAQVVPQLIQELIGSVGVLSNHGFEQAEVYAAARDYEDAQIAASARSLPGRSVCIVTEDNTFDTLGEIPTMPPKQALDWVSHDEEAPTSQPASLPFIDLAAQQVIVRPAIERGVETVLRHGRYVMGPEIDELEQRLADFVGVKHCIGVSSGTDALLIALMALDIGAGDEVITTPFTFIATGEMIALLGATPVFVDIDPDSYNIDPDRIEAAITPRTRAIMPVSLYGQCADMDAIDAIAGRHGLPVIEDGAQSLGATCNGQQSCGLSTIGCTSFFPSKPLGGYGDGGACFTDDDRLDQVMRQIRMHGEESRYQHSRIGINGRLDSLQAGILLAKLDIFPQEVELRQQAGQRYTRLLQEQVPEVVPPAIDAGNTSVYAQYTIQVSAREQVQKRLSRHGIPTAVHYPRPLHRQPALYTEAFDLPVSERLSERVISLPMHPYITEDEQRTVVDALASC